MGKSTHKPFVLYVAETIYLEIFKLNFEKMTINIFAKY